MLAIRNLCSVKSSFIICRIEEEEETAKLNPFLKFTLIIIVKRIRRANLMVGCQKKSITIVYI